MTSQAYVDGEYVSLENATVSLRDRGFLFGDGVYDVVRIVQGSCFRLERHLERLRRNARELEFCELPDRARLREIVGELLDRSGLEEGKLYMQLTRGAAPRESTYPEGVEPTLVVYVDEMRRGADAIRDQGASATIVPEMRWERCDIKSVNLLPKVLMKQRAQRQGCYEAIFASESGVVWEGASTNLFVVEEGRLRTTDHDRRVLPGLTRREVVEIAVEHEIAVDLSTVRVEDLYRADEVFLTGTLTGVLGVVDIDGREVGGGRVGPCTEKLWGELVRRRREAAGS